MANDPAALFPIAREAFRGETFAGGRPLQFAEVGVVPAHPIVIRRRFNARRTRSVGIGFRRDVDTALACARDERQNRGSQLAGATVQVHAVQRRSGGGGVRDAFLKCTEGPVPRVWMKSGTPRSLAN